MTRKEPDLEAAPPAQLESALSRLPARAEYVELRRLFPARPARPRQYNRRYAVQRKVRCCYLFPGDQVPTACPAGWDLLVVLGVAFESHDLDRLESQVQSSLSGPAVAVGWLKDPLSDLRPQLLQVAARRLLAGEGLAPDPSVGRLAETLRRTLSARLAPRHFNWFHRGKTLPPAPEYTRRVFYARILEEIYADTPTGLRADRQTCRVAAKELLDAKMPLLLETPYEQGLSGLFKRTFGDEGLLALKEDGGAFRVAELEGPQDLDSPGRRLFDSLLRKLYSPERSSQDVSHRLSDLLSWLGAPPRGLRGPAAQVYLAAALRVHAQDLELSCAGHCLELNPENLRRALDKPSDWDLFYHRPDRNTQAFLRTVTRLFGGSSGDPFPASRDLWQSAFQEVAHWWARLPPWTRSPEAELTEQTAALSALLQNTLKEDPREFLATKLPAAFGLPALPPLEEQSTFVDRLETARQELNDFLDRRHDRLAGQLIKLFTVESTPAALDAASKSWLNKLHPSTVDRVGFSPWAEGLRQAIQAEGDMVARWFLDLPRALEMSPPADWTDDQSQVFLARVAVAALELRIWPAQQIFPLPENPQERQALLAEWCQKTLHIARLSEERAEGLLLALLEELVWS